jgi:hypothetical protein
MAERTDKALSIVQVATSQVQERQNEQKAQLDRIEKKQDTILQQQNLILEALTSGSNNSPSRKLRKLAEPSDVGSGAPAQAPASGAPRTGGDVFARMMTASARRAPDHFENLGTWDCVKFVVETIKQGVNAEATAAWGGVDKTTQGRAKKVFLALKDAASDDDKKYFSAVQCPKEGTDRTDWLDSVEEVVSRLVQAVVTKLIRDREAFKGNILSNEDVQKELKKAENECQCDWWIDREGSYVE